MSSPAPTPLRATGPAARALLALAVLAGGCGPRDREGLVRRPLTPRTESGWTRLSLDAEAQRMPGEPWVSDDAGAPVPLLREGPAVWGPRRLDIDRLILGTDAEGRVSAEFSLRLPPVWAVREREHLRIDLDLQGKAPWACRVDVARRLEGAALLGLPRTSPLQVHDLGRGESVSSLLVPWDAREYRLVLQPMLGTAPNLRNVRVSAVTEPAGLEAARVLAPADLTCEIPAPAPERWRLRLPAEERVVGLEVALKPAAPPGRPVVVVPAAGPGEAPRSLKVQDLVWNLPPKGGRGSRVDLDPLLTDRLVVVLPAGARLETVKVLVRPEELLFPVQAGRRYWLHLGGRARKAAGEPPPLPPGRQVYARDPMRLGPPEPDPQGLPQPRVLNRTPWLRAGALGGAALLALLAGFLLFRRREA